MVVLWRCPTAVALLSPPARRGATLDLAAIAAGLASALTGAELPLAGGQSRDFARLLVTPQYEAWLIAWAPAGGLELHDPLPSMTFYDVGLDGALVRASARRGDLVTLEDAAGR